MMMMGADQADIEQMLEESGGIDKDFIREEIQLD